MALPRRLPILLLGLVLAAPTLAAEVVDPAVAKAYAAAPRLSFGALDLDKLASEDAISDQISGIARRFAVPRDVAVSPKGDGVWSQDAKGRWVWRLGVAADGAVHLNFGFRDFALPEGAKMLILGAEADDVLGPYTQADRLPHGELWTPVLEGSKALIEVTLPKGAQPELNFTLQRVAQGYRGFGHRSKACKSGSCNTDVACLASSDPWNQPRRAVGAYTVGGTDACTGALINNTRNDRRMLFATATHCQVDSDADAARVLVYWRYESPTCRTPGSAASGTPLAKPSGRTTQGLRFVAATNNPFAGTSPANTRSDWTLLELATPPANNDFQLYWSGWDRSPPPSACAAPADATSTSGLCASIHHPSVDEKRITFVEQTMPLGNIAGATGVHFTAQWDSTPPRLPGIQPPPASLPPSVTEPGSSGSPLFNAERRLIGVLSGGASACGVDVTRLNDEYGGLFHAWDGLGSASTRMRDHLDPTNSGVTRLDGVDSQATTSLTVALDSPAFSSAPAAGDVVVLSASASGGNGSYTYEWDIDGDNQIDRRGSASSLSLSYPSAGGRQVSLRVRDGAGAEGSAQRSLTVRGPRIAATAGTPAQICGNNDAQFDPGERWRLPVQLNNSGDAGLGAAHALFAVSGAAATLDLGPNSFGYAGTGSCAHEFIDIASGGNAVGALSLSDPDDGRTAQPIALGGQGILLYGQRYTQAVMSTNGYVSFDLNESGGDWSNNCSGALDLGATGPQIRPYHDDLVVNSGGGLRYRYFASCPRAAQAGGAQGCHVFQWSNMGTFDSGGSFEFQAIAYEQSGQFAYQYRSVDPLSGGSATVGLVAAGGNDPLNLSCNAANSLRAGGSFCAYAPNATPADGRKASLARGAATLSPLGSGQSATVELEVKIDQDAACGAPVAIDYVATVGSIVHSSEGGSLFSRNIAASCQPVSSCAATTTQAARRGLYYNLERPGNGLNGYFYDVGPGTQFFGGLWYTALADRSPVWYQIAGEVRDFSGEIPLVEVRNAAAPSGFNPTSTPVGRAWVAQLDDDSLLLAWQFNDGRRGAQRMDTTPGVTFAAQNHTQAWFAPSEQGWGLAIESLGLGVAGGGGNTELEFFATYIFDGSGAPRWVIGDKPNAASGNVSLFTLDVNCPGCAHFGDYGDTARAAGSLNIQYSARNSATLSTGITLPAPLNGNWTRNSLNIVPIADPQP